MSSLVKYTVKRDGRIADYDDGRIYSAIIKAMSATKAGPDEGLADYLTVKVNNLIEKHCEDNGSDRISVDLIHEYVENALMASPRTDAAQEYIRYREKRNLARKADSIAIFDSIVKAQANEITRENANMNADTPAGMMMKFASEASKTYVDECLLSRDVRNAVKNNYIHIHDKDYYPTKSLTCIQHPTDMLLKNGFVDGHASVRPAKRIETAATIACISMEAVQNEMHGGQAIPAFDFYMAPFVRKAFEEEASKICGSLALIIDGLTAAEIYRRTKLIPIKDYISKGIENDDDLIKALSNDGDLSDLDTVSGRVWQEAVNLTVKRVHQAMESFVHNMNTIHSRGGNQVVFSSINYGTDTSPEGRCIIREILNTTYEGVGNGETAIFPIQIWKKKRGVSYLPGDPNYDLYVYACKVTAKRFYPNYLNLDASYNQDPAWKSDDPERYIHEVATMGCRTRVYADRFGMKTSIGRGNLSFTTVNIVRIAIEAMKAFPEDKDLRIEVFFQRFDRALGVAARQLHERYKFQCTALAKQFPMLMSGMWVGSEKLKPGDSVADVLKHGTLSIGFIGLAECLIALVGKHHGESEEAQKLGLRIVSHMADKVNEFADRYNLNYTLLATPAEGLAGRFTKIDRKEFGVIEGITDKDYYTNSSHIPVYYKCTPKHKAEIEGPYHKFENAGHIFYVEMDGDATHNPEAIMRVVDLMDRYDIGYGSVNHNRCRCLDCGFETGQHDVKVCPKCGSDHIDILQRITGYLVGTTERWNSAKKAELKDRVVHE